MIIQAGEYKLRNFTKKDVNSFFELAHDELVEKYVPYAYPNDIEEAQEMVECYENGDCKNDFYFLIEHEDVLFGVIIAVRTIDKTLEVSVLMSKQFRGKGIMKISMEAFIKWIRDNTDYKKLVMYINKENLASNNLIQKIGGVFQKDTKSDNIYEILIR